MSSISGRFFTFVKKEKTRDFFAFIIYVLFIVFTIDIDMPLALEIICFIIVMCISAIGSRVYLVDWLDEHYVKNHEIGKNIRQELKKIVKELAIYIPIWAISNWLLSLILVGQPTNQTSIEESFKIAPISTSILAIVI